MEDIIKTITTKKGARVSLVQPQEGRPFFRYEAGASAIIDSFRYIIRQHGQEDTATVTVNVEVPVEEDTAQDHFNQQLQGFLKCMEKLIKKRYKGVMYRGCRSASNHRRCNPECWTPASVDPRVFTGFSKAPQGPRAFITRCF